MKTEKVEKVEKVERVFDIDSIARSITSLVGAFFSIIKLALATIVLIIVWENQKLVGSYLSQWLDTTTHIVAFGFTVDRQISADRKLNEIANKPDTNKINLSVARGAIIRASRNAAAITGSRILWVDPHPQNNDLEAGIFNDMGIEVRRANSTDEAVQMLKSFTPDLIISNLTRSDDKRVPLTRCQAHYYQVPSSMPYDLDHLNLSILAGSSEYNGFGMAELLSQTYPAFTDPEHSRIIYYTSISGGFAASRCARVVTNQVDVLLQNVVSALEESRWQKLDGR